MKFVVIACLCAGAVAAIGCTDGRGGPTSPSAADGVSGLASLPASPRSGDLYVTKTCLTYTGLAGDFCRITSSDVKAIEIGTRVVYGQAAGATSLDSDVVLDTPGPGNNKAFGHCRLDFTTLSGLCTFSGGTGKFNGFSASVSVSYLGGSDWAWDGTYSFSPRD